MSDEQPTMTPIDWWRGLVQEQAWVIHIRSGTVGRVARFFDGEGHVYEPKVEKAEAYEHARSTPVVELEEGHTFHAAPDQFMRLSGPQERFYRAAVEGVGNFTLELARFAASAGIPQSLFQSLLGSAMRSQLQALGRQHETPTDKPPAGGG